MWALYSTPNPLILKWALPSAKSLLRHHTSEFSLALGLAFSNSWASSLWLLVPKAQETAQGYVRHMLAGLPSGASRI